MFATIMQTIRSLLTHGRTLQNEEEREDVALNLMENYLPKLTKGSPEEKEAQKAIEELFPTPPEGWGGKP